MSSRINSCPIIAMLLLSANAFAQRAATRELSPEEVVDRVIKVEADFIHDLSKFRPVIETYLQFTDQVSKRKDQVSGDAYFIGKLDFNGGVGFESFAPEKSSGFRILSFLKKPERFRVLPGGFAQMTVLDPSELDRAHYVFENLHQDFLGEVRCFVLDVRPRNREGRFIGRIWAEDRGYHVVRYSGTYASKHLIRYFHFNGYRQQMGPGLWLPSAIYVEHSFKHIKRPRGVPSGLKAQVRLWSYGLSSESRPSTFTDIKIETPDPSQDRSASDLSTTEALREWKREAEDNILKKMEKAGLLAPEGEMEKILDAVLNNLAVTNKIAIAPPLRCRILLTTPLESCSIGHSIVLSRGLIDVLPNEATLAAVIARELAHVLLSNDIETINAFNDRMMFDDSRVFQQFSFLRTKEEEDNANRKAMELLNNSPYKKDLPSVGLFLAALQAKSHAVPNLLKAYVGNTVVENGKVTLLPELVSMSPPLAPDDVLQLPALPIASRLRLEPWDNRAEVLNAKPVSILSLDEKLPFEVTPIVLALRGRPRQSLQNSVNSIGEK